MAQAFRYFERIDEASGHCTFWEIAVDGPAIELRHGAVGTPGKHEREMCASEAAARDEYGRMVAVRVGDGYRECPDRRLDARTRALEGAIEAELDGVDAYLVYADWIQTLGDPRGALIVAQAGQQAAQAAELLAQHAAVFLGPLAEHIGYDGAPLELRWHCGFVRGARLVARGYWSPAPGPVVTELFAHPSARWLRELAIDVAGRYDGDDVWPVQVAIDVVAERVRPGIVALDIGELGRIRDPDEYDEDLPRTERANLAALWRAVPNVRRVVLRGDPGALLKPEDPSARNRIDLPELEHLEVHTNELSPRLMAAFRLANMPKLRRLDLRYRRPGGRERYVALSELLPSRIARSLHQLAITGCAAADEVAQLIAEGTWTELRELDLSDGMLRDAGADALGASKLALDILDVSRNMLTSSGVASLERVAKLVIAERQKPRW